MKPLLVLSLLLVAVVRIPQLRADEGAAAPEATTTTEQTDESRHTHFKSGKKAEWQVINRLNERIARLETELRACRRRAHKLEQAAAAPKGCGPVSDDALKGLSPSGKAILDVDDNGHPARGGAGSANPHD